MFFPRTLLLVGFSLLCLFHRTARSLQTFSDPGSYQNTYCSGNEDCYVECLTYRNCIDTTIWFDDTSSGHSLTINCTAGQESCYNLRVYANISGPFYGHFDDVYAARHARFIMTLWGDNSTVNAECLDTPNSTSSLKWQYRQPCRDTSWILTGTQWVNGQSQMANILTKQKNQTAIHFLLCI